ncbi:MAG: hypothetical protein WC569_01755 [Candidatus Omnitrophota bacterium]
MNTMLKSYINKNEISQPKTPNEFIEWFEQKLKITKNHREELKKQNILHEGIAKKFYEELFPLYRFLQHKAEEWHDVKINYSPGNQNFDVEVKSDREFIPKYIEITQADMNENESLRMRYFSKKSTVSMTGKVLKKGTKRTGLRISVDDEAKKRCVLISEKMEQIRIAINKKINVTKRPDSTALLVYFDDYIGFTQNKERQKINVFLSKNESWKKQYIYLFVVGASGEFFWEKVERNNE